MDVNKLFRAQSLNNISHRQTQPWRKLLWIHQQYPDNYVDGSFLSQLKRNTNIQYYTLWTLVLDSTVVIVHLSTVAIFIILFLGIYNHNWSPVIITSASTVSTLAGYIMWDQLGPGDNHRESTIRSSILIVFTILALSPVFKSLTQSTSSDSIWALASWLCLANIYCHDYESGPQVKLKPILSTNLILSAALVLASRLPTSVSVFCFVLFSIQTFGLFPIFVRWVRFTSETGYWILFTFLLIASNLGLYNMAGTWALIVWTVIELCVTFIGPLWFIRLQKYKNEIQGPWDPAKPVIRSDPNC
ncbi:phosphatidylinositol N-acetylglucosaminyltransferase [Nadsonia fulvescens var. elongata DSM 6958]|uniref:Phosphatidylinositol N-acetylglucosaminyltransferase n=1 Tax=Nadsonia fulvescens var. elongata DSM 6958 TaxID=857566 RepID=A0A1E3PKT5_9ASCO|nr:phosphatidylinositol N-acetylglucosaminyltransferase [Nadsonia fulvescens var. elongata DSM 6958]